MIGAGAWGARRGSRSRASSKPFARLASLAIWRTPKRSRGPVLRGFEEAGVQTLILPDEILQELARASDAVLAQEAAHDEDFRRVLESQRAFSAEYARWRRVAYPAPPHTPPASRHRELGRKRERAAAR